MAIYRKRKTAIKKTIRRKRVSKFRKRSTKGVFQRNTGMASLQCNPRINRASQVLTLRNPVNRRAGTSVVPAKYFCTMPYHELVGLNLGTVGCDYVTFRLNSIFDPNKSGTGHQPRGHDQMATLYQGYQVYGMAYQITAFTKDTTREGFTIFVTAGTSQYGGLPLNVSSIHEYTQHRVRYATLSNEQPIAKISGYWNCANAEKVSKKDYAVGDDFKAGMGANPASSPQIFFGAHTLDGSTSTQGVELQIDLLYYVKCELPVPLGAS